MAATAAWLLERHPEHAALLQMATMLASLLLVVLAEHVLPLRLDWQRGTPADRRTDWTLMAVLMLLVDPIVKRGLLPLVATLSGPLAAGGSGLAWFPSRWPLVPQLLLAAVIAEWGQYAVHRAMHSIRWLGALHGFHHNPTRIYWLNGFRAHPLNMIVHQLAGLGVLLAIGTPAAVMQMLILSATVTSVFQHANAELRYDGWNLVFSTADLHRWHHAAGTEYAPVNFGGLLMVWDHVFGTYHRGGACHGPWASMLVRRARGYLPALAEAMRHAVQRRAV